MITEWLSGDLEFHCFKGLRWFYVARRLKVLGHKDRELTRYMIHLGAFNFIKIIFTMFLRSIAAT